jgi:predicted HicB family RNase H-like nuclease
MANQWMNWGPPSVKPYPGNMMPRVGKDIHAASAATAELAGKSLN